MNNDKKLISSVVFIAMGLCQYLSTENQTIFMCICLAFLGILFCFVVRRVSSVLVSIRIWIRHFLRQRMEARGAGMIA